MLLFDEVITKCCLQFGNDRSASAVYHLLKGKRSIQTIQDSHIYKLEKYFGIYKRLTKQVFNNHIDKLIQNNQLVQTDQAVLPTEQSVRSLKNQHNTLINAFNGLKYSNRDTIFLQRLFLLIQTLANIKKRYFSFIPVVDKPEITNWVKYYYKKMGPRQTVTLHDELSYILSLYTERDASLFVDSLTGFKHYGMSTYQLAEQYDLNRVEVPLYLIAITHQMLDIIEQSPDEYSILSVINRDLHHGTSLSESTGKTKALMDNGYSADEIASMRYLKVSTIYDHIVEIALYDMQFPIEDYVSICQQQEILTSSERLKSYKLKDIKQEVGDKITYFQIRLTLALKKV